ncbi:MAG: LamG domain-containing protein, partial [Nanoarchaeota archaeon]
IQFDGLVGSAVNSTILGTTVAPNPGPTIVNVTPNGTKFAPNATVNITANVTDADSVDIVFANITLPNGSTRRLTMINASSTIYRTNFSETSLNGTYNITIIANDSLNNIGTLGGANFSVNSSPVVARVNITPFTPNSSTSVAGVWNYTDADGDAENGSTWTWFVNGSEVWRDASLVSYWRMEGNGIDVLGLNNGTVVNATNVSGLVKGALNFDKNAFINVSSSSSLQPSVISISLWVLTNVSGSGRLVTKTRAGSTQSYSLGVSMAASNGLAEFRTDTPSTTFTTSRVGVADGKWHHIVGIDNGTNISVYVDGVLSNSTSVSGSPTYDTGSLEIGRYGSGSTEYFNGSIDEIKIFNRTLSADEIVNEYQMMSYGSTEKDATGTPAPDIPVAAWHFDDGVGATSAFDYFGDNQARISNATKTTGVFGTEGMFFNKINATLIVNNSPSINLSGNFTILLWTGSNYTDSENLNYLLLKESSYGILKPIGGTNLRCVISNSTSSTAAHPTGMNNSGVLEHVACVYNGTTFSAYRNAVLTESVSFTGGTNTTTNPLLFGGLNSVLFNGTIDEVEIYNRVFTPEEINQSYRRSFPLFGLNTSRFGANDSLTFQLEPIQYDGTVGDALNSSTVTTSAPPPDTTVPTIVNVTPNGTSFAANVTVNITANVTDAGSVDTVFANITLPNGSTRRLTMVNASSTIYRTNFSETGTTGLYNLTIIANDSVNNIATLGGANFTINTVPVVIRVNITSFNPNSSTAVSGVWNYTDADGDAENGSTWTWFLNGTEMWKDASLVSYWRLDQNSFDVLSRNNGTINNGVSNTTGVIKSSLDFNGNTGYVNVGDNANLNITEAITVSAWVKHRGAFKTGLAGFEGILVKGDSAYRLQLCSASSANCPENSSTNSFMWSVHNACAQTDMGSDIVPVEGRWYHVVGTYDRSNTRIYVDGVQKNSLACTVAIPTNSFNVSIGENLQATGRFWNGSIDEVKIYNRSLSAAEIA